MRDTQWKYTEIFVSMLLIHCASLGRRAAWPPVCGLQTLSGPEASFGPAQICSPVCKAFLCPSSQSHCSHYLPQHRNMSRRGKGWVSSAGASLPPYENQTSLPASNRCHCIFVLWLELLVHGRRHSVASSLHRAVVEEGAGARQMSHPDRPLARTRLSPGWAYSGWGHGFFHAGSSIISKGETELTFWN